MGEHLKEKLTTIERWLRSQHGDSDCRSLDYIYSEEYKARWKPKKPFEVDYVKEINGKMVYADVIGPNDEWRGILGKALCFTANAEQADQDYEVWLVTDLDDDPKTAGLQGEEKARYVEGWHMYFRDLKRLIGLTMRPEITGRVRIKHVVRHGEDLSLEEIGQ